MKMYEISVRGNTSYMFWIIINRLCWCRATYILMASGTCTRFIETKNADNNRNNLFVSWKLYSHVWHITGSRVQMDTIRLTNYSGVLFFVSR